jgi:hypothetical protein
MSTKRRLKAEVKEKWREMLYFRVLLGAWYKGEIRLNDKGGIYIHIYVYIFIYLCTYVYQAG